MTSREDKEYLVKELNPEKRYNYKDYLSWDDAQRYELIDGIVYIMSPAPGRIHQKISGEIHRQLANYLFDKECEVYIAPFDIRLPESDEKDENITTVVQPDISVICKQEKLDERGCRGAPDLLIEVLSPSSGTRDKKIKRALYEKHGVKEYWIVDYNINAVEVYLLQEDGEYGKPVIYSEEEQLPVSIFNDLKIDLSLVFR